MKIFKQEPKDWKELQIFTERILNNIGYNTEIEKDVLTVRGIVNIDVFAKNENIKPSSTIICECKYWNTAIPQTIIHAFRTVLSDIGVNNGFIISKIGFQAGAFEAVKNTNLSLFTWDKFQNYFKESWIKSKTFQINKINQDLQTYISAGFSIYFKEEYNNLTKSEYEEFQKLNLEYFHTAFYSMEHDYRDLETKEFDLKYFEHHIKEAEKIYGTNFNSYEEFFDFLVNDAKVGVQKFDRLFKKELRKKNYS